MNNTIRILSQAFYGNKTETDIRGENIDHFILGNLDFKMPIDEKANRTIVKVPDNENIVIIYNKYAEDKSGKPLAIIPQYDLKIYSRCIACRINENGAFESLHDEDYDVLDKYFAD